MRPNGSRLSCAATIQWSQMEFFTTCAGGASSNRWCGGTAPWANPTLWARNSNGRRRGRRLLKTKNVLGGSNMPSQSIALHGKVAEQRRLV